MERVRSNEIDTNDEITKVFNRLIDNEAIIEAKVCQLDAKVNQIETKVRNMKKPQKKEGFALIKSLLIIPVILLLATSIFGYEAGDINYDIAANPEMLYRYLEDAVGAGTFVFTPMAAPTGNDIIEGKMYYDETANAMYYSNDGSTWTAFDAGSAVSLDGAYNVGSSITVDSSAVTLTVADTAISALAIVSANATDDTDAVTITTTTAGYTGDSLYINGVSGSTDIRGDNWNMSQSGILTCLGLVTSTADVTFTATLYDIIHDASANQLEFQDSAELSFGTDDDVSITYDGSGDDLDILFDDLEIAFGADGAGRE